MAVSHRGNLRSGAPPRGYPALRRVIAIAPHAPQFVSQLGRVIAIAPHAPQFVSQLPRRFAEAGALEPGALWARLVANQCEFSLLRKHEHA